MTKNKYKISVVGAGKVGTAFSYSLFLKGFDFLTIVDKNLKKANKLKSFVHAKNSSKNVEKIKSETTLLLITTPDDVISSISNQVSKLKNINFRNLIVIHTSGTHSTDVLKPLELKGARVLSFHPIQTFAPKNNNLPPQFLLQNIYFGVETKKKNFLIAKIFAKYLNSNIIFIKKELKPLYHIACVFASNYIVTNLNAVELLSRKIKINKAWKEAFKPLIEKSISNALKYSPSQVLTGPVERGDIETVQKHIEELKIFAPELIKFYCILGIETLKIVIERKSLNKYKLSKIKKLFEQYISIRKKL